VALATVLAGAAATQAAETQPFSLVDGDRVVLLGSTLVEREQSHGYWETALASRFHGRNIQFRNLGWSGDNVWGEARAGFGSVADGFAHLKEHVLALKPTLIFLNYGANESFAGKAGLAGFQAGLATLLATLDASGASIVFLGPAPQEDLGRPLPDPAEHNRDLKLYSDAIAAVAAGRDAPMVNFFELLGKKLRPSSPLPLTDNGIHLTAYGYWRAAPVLEQGLGLPARRWQIEIDTKQQNIAARGAAIRQARFSPEAIGFRVTDEQLPLAPAPAGVPAAVADAVGTRTLQVLNLPAGNYALEIDGRRLALATSQGWSAGVTLREGPDFEQAETLRQTILAKNQLYFHRWRPQNETYLFGFRKHEQGNNAIEIPQFDPLVAAKEAVIQQQSVPVERQYQIIKVEAK
jgi:lysophospholipase L1-like esterase